MSLIWGLILNYHIGGHLNGNELIKYNIWQYSALGKPCRFHHMPRSIVMRWNMSIIVRRDSFRIWRRALAGAELISPRCQTIGYLSALISIVRGLPWRISSLLKSAPTGFAKLSRHAHLAAASAPSKIFEASRGSVKRRRLLMASIDNYFIDDDY